MEHSIALVTGTTSGLGYAAARALAGKGWREIIVTGRSLARVQETAAQLAADTKMQVFTPLELDIPTKQKGLALSTLIAAAAHAGGSRPHSCLAAWKVT